MKDAALDGDMREAVSSLVRGDWKPFESTLTQHGEAVVLPESRCVMRCHYIVSDPAGKPRVHALAKQLAKQIVRFCIPRSDLLKARAIEDEDAREEEVTRLTLDAQRLFTRKQPKTGEGGELLLFALLERLLGIPQILSKMSLKTNTDVQVHGTDGVRAHMLDDDVLALYWGEAKVYEDLADAVSSCFKSVGPFLRGEIESDQDVFLITHYADTGDQRITEGLIEYFDNDSVKSAKLEVRAGCLIGFPQGDYPRLPANRDSLAKALESAAAGWGSRVGARLKSQDLTAFHIELFMVPLPSAEDFRKAIRAALNIER